MIKWILCSKGVPEKNLSSNKNFILLLHEMYLNILIINFAYRIYTYNKLGVVVLLVAVCDCNIHN